MERPGAKPSLHRLIGEAVMRATHTQEASREAIDQTQEAAAKLRLTVAEVHRCRALRAFGNRQSDAGEAQRAG